MNFYAITDGNNAIIAWESTQADAKRTAKEYDCEVTSMDVPTAKDDLLEFLRKYVIGVDADTGEPVEASGDGDGDGEGEGEEVAEGEEAEGEEVAEGEEAASAEEVAELRTTVEDLTTRVNDLEETLSNTQAEFAEAINEIRAAKPAKPAKPEATRSAAPAKKAAPPVKGGKPVGLARRAGRR